MDTAVALFQKKFFFGRQLCLQPVVTSPPGENGRWNTRNTRNKERGGGGDSPNDGNLFETIENMDKRKIGLEREREREGRRYNYAIIG